DLNPRSDRLFARGPAFVLVQTPSGNRLWVGTNHQKSKAGEDGLADTRWRNAEALATRRIIQDLAARSDGTAGVVFLGDLNDQLGIQAWELEGGGDTVANLVGPPDTGLELATRKLAEDGVASYMGYWRPTYRGLIDHIVITQNLAPSVGQVAVFDSAWARVASDHLPVYIDLRLDGECPRAACGLSHRPVPGRDPGARIGHVQAPRHRPLDPGGPEHRRLRLDARQSPGTAGPGRAGHRGCRPRRGG